MSGASLAAAGSVILGRRALVSYDTLVEKIWQPHSGVPGHHPQRLRELVRLATLAPSGHNTQCWNFRIRESSISIHPDETRRAPVVNPDDHHQYLSLGCATENLLQAGAALGLRGEMSFSAGPSTAVEIALEPAPPHSTNLFAAITYRQSTRAEFNGMPLSPQELKLLEAAREGPGVSVRLLTARKTIDNVLDLVIEANTVQLEDRAFLQELRHWVRFNPVQAIRQRDGLFSGCSGNPSLPPWLGELLFERVVTPALPVRRGSRSGKRQAGSGRSLRSRPRHAAVPATADRIRSAGRSEPMNGRD